MGSEETLGARLRRLRVQGGTTIQEVASAVGESEDVINRIEADELVDPPFFLGLRLAEFFRMSPHDFASGRTRSEDVAMRALETRLAELEQSIPGAPDTAETISILGLSAVRYDAIERVSAVEAGIALYPLHLREAVSNAGISAAIFSPLGFYRRESPYLRDELEADFDAFDKSPAGVFVVSERRLYLRVSSIMVVAHEYAHAIDLALGGRRYLSHRSRAIRRAFVRASRRQSFVTPYAGTSVEEYFAEGLRAMAEANEPRSALPPVSRDALAAKDPLLFAICTSLFDGTVRRSPRQYVCLSRQPVTVQSPS
jgi:transcriptional regulator with XRE-family HTH domain